MSESAYRPEFEAALRLLAQVSEAMVARGLRRPILVGGAAAEFYSQSAISTGDFDLCTFRQRELEEEMLRLGFVRPSGAGQMLKGWVHPDLKLGFEVVAETPMDGAFDPATLALVGNTGNSSFVVISVEDLIADRMGQYRRAARRTGWIRRARCSRFNLRSTGTILTAASGKKRPATMASKRSNPTDDLPGRRLDMADFGQRIAARKAELGVSDPPRNAGKNRTASKRALLKAIEDAGGKW